MLSELESFFSSDESSLEEVPVLIESVVGLSDISFSEEDDNSEVVVSFEVSFELILVEVLSVVTAVPSYVS